MPVVFEKIEWYAPEYRHVKKGPDWYWAVGIITLAIAVGAIIFKDFLFAIFIVLGGITLCTYGMKPPRTIRYEITKEGIALQDYLYQYSNIKGFAVRGKGKDQKLIFQSSRAIMPVIAIPSPDIDPDDLRAKLEQFIEEKDLHEPPSHKIMEYLGF